MKWRKNAAASCNRERFRLSALVIPLGAETSSGSGDDDDDDAVRGSASPALPYISQHQQGQ
jgi:hypothetical protein